MNKQLFLILLFIFPFFSSAMSQEKGPHHFSPEKYKADLEQFIVKEACLTAQEAARFFPLYDEMNVKKRVCYDNIKKIGVNKPKTEKECAAAIRRRDKLELEIKQIEQTYHNKFLSILPACKAFAAINAEDHFHRGMLRQAAPAKRQRDGGR